MQDVTCGINKDDEHLHLLLPHCFPSLIHPVSFSFFSLIYVHFCHLFSTSVYIDTRKHSYGMQRELFSMTKRIVLTKFPLWNLLSRQGKACPLKKNKINYYYGSREVTQCTTSERWKP